MKENLNGQKENILLVEDYFNYYQPYWGSAGEE